MPDGGTFLFFDTTPYLRPGENVMGFLERCLEGGVMLTPGSASGQAYESWARICFTTVTPAELSEALGCLKKILRS
jgi:aspartate/methionine/tyrosine aminotransferase